jgi:hypothetical protein
MPAFFRRFRYPRSLNSRPNALGEVASSASACAQAVYSWYKTEALTLAPSPSRNVHR